MLVLLRSGTYGSIPPNLLFQKTNNKAKVKANIDDFKLAIIADFEGKQHKNKDLIDEAIKAFSIKLKEKMQSASENMTTVEVKLESSVQDMKNALSSSHDNLQKQVFFSVFLNYVQTGQSKMPRTRQNLRLLNGILHMLP